MRVILHWRSQGTGVKGQIVRRGEAMVRGHDRVENISPKLPTTPLLVVVLGLGQNLLRENQLNLLRDTHRVREE